MNDDLLLRELLTDVRSMRDNVQDIQSRMVSKEDFNRYQDQMATKFENIEETQEDHTLDIADAKKFIGTVRWTVRVIAVAVMGLGISAISSFVHLNVGVQGNTTPASAATSKQLHVNQSLYPNDYNVHITHSIIHNH
jgi:hypothetical protein